MKWIKVIRKNNFVQVLGDGIWFYEEFFGSMMSGLQSKIETISVTEATLLITSYVECLQYAIVKGDESEIIINYLINKQVPEKFHL